MPELVADCPRCGSGRITFDLHGANWIGKSYDWQHKYEAFCVCRRCHRSTVFYIAKSTDAYDAKVNTEQQVKDYDGSLNDCFGIEGYLSLKDRDPIPPPEHLSEKIETAFREGATCMAAGCFNAAGTMFRLCLDFATKALLPKEEVAGLNSKIRGSLGLRMKWLFDTGGLPAALEELATCVKDDGNDGAHDGTLSKIEAEDLQEFTFELLERLYTEPKRLAIAKARREARHRQAKGG
jgi:hypothetical protein